MGKTSGIWFVKYKEKNFDEWKSLKCQKGWKFLCAFGIEEQGAIY